ncbi:hypothetical protein RFI_34497 [Reticulomyxa filosa]|uniref:Uncharacterized protein n=1 Tax=Reticulomyxa filosa TaxID=46433 RepID=X6LNI6_RETFI|nr:hypothetical protein RFI_34497 [Reticulomyxa filosa]|eukprot:ETO02916.1 hypothetical protein RFI_34497 [Reticulomyxa filosa]
MGSKHLPFVLHFKLDRETKIKIDSSMEVITITPTTRPNSTAINNHLTMHAFVKKKKKFSDKKKIYFKILMDNFYKGERNKDEDEKKNIKKK